LLFVGEQGAEEKKKENIIGHLNGLSPEGKGKKAFPQSSNAPEGNSFLIQRSKIQNASWWETRFFFKLKYASKLANIKQLYFKKSWDMQILCKNSNSKILLIFYAILSRKNIKFNLPFYQNNKISCQKISQLHGKELWHKGAFASYLLCGKGELSREVHWPESGRLLARVGLSALECHLSEAGVPKGC